MLPRLLEIERRFADVERDLMNPAIAGKPSEMRRLGRARRELEPVVEATRRYRRTLEELDQAEAMLADPELRALAQEEAERLREDRSAIEEELKIMLLPRDPNDGRSVIMEIRPAAGGDEAGLFAADLMRMYLRMAERLRWKVEIIDQEETGLGGISWVTLRIDADGAYSRLKFESGVHRVQRVPKTESQGRIHTSTVTVAVLPEAEEVDVEIKTDDLEVTTYRSSSAGGQHVQKNETAIRIIHKPTGLMSTCQDERSQAQNKEKAMAVLRTKLYEMEQERLAKERGEMRRGQVGTGDRSEKIRTYNFPQDRITDHRIGMDLFGIPQALAGDIDRLLDALIQDEQARLLAQAGDSV
ncbi:MAG: peptide chain release factor 1 [Fimbriimonadaceae bacterium]|nr:peptide chain release factor 1 [Fimbriimonadaceae bacterium]